MIGDVTSPGGVSHLTENLWRFRRENAVDFCVVNGENASLVYTMKEKQAKELFAAGADVITGGNHTMRDLSGFSFLEREKNVLRPYNFPTDVPGHGYTVCDVCGFRLLVMNVMGQIHMDPVLDSPFAAIERILMREEGKYDLAVLDFHAEATGEKLAVGYAFDGRIQAIVGTHTHVPTADAHILPGGTAYVTDLGMCGESEGILGMEPKGVVKRMREHLSYPFAAAKGKPVAQGVLVTLDTDRKAATSIDRIEF